MQILLFENVHNLILEHDGLDRLWEENVNWRKIDPMGEDDTLTED